jgi:hypothetical protein
VGVMVAHPARVSAIPARAIIEIDFISLFSRPRRLAWSYYRLR